MAIRAEMKYHGTVAPGSSIVESRNGTLSFQVMLECEDGDAYFPIWLTDKNKEKAIKTLEMLGADPAKLNSSNYLELELPNLITGKEVSFGTREEEYNGKKTVKVAWIGKKTDPNAFKGAAKFFGSTQNGNQTPETEKGITDEDIPF